MLKKFLAIATLVCALPVMANAASWSLNTWAKAAGGVISSRNGAAQTSLQGSVFKTYTTHATLPVTVTANTGYTISKIVRNGVDIGAQASPYSTTVAGFTAQGIQATFLPQLMS